MTFPAENLDKITLTQPYTNCRLQYLLHVLNPLTAGVAYIRVFIFY